ASILPKAKLAAVVAFDEVLMRVRDASNWRGNSGVRYASLANAAADATGGHPSNERVHVVKKGDTVTSILRDQGATPEEAKSIASTLGARGRDGGLKEGQKLRILMAPAGPGPGPR